MRRGKLLCFEHNAEISRLSAGLRLLYILFGVFGMDRNIIDRLRDSLPTGTVGGLLLNDAADEIVRLWEVEKTVAIFLHLLDEYDDDKGPITMPGLMWSSVEAMRRLIVT